MVDLSTLDVRSPRDTELVSLGDDAIRATKEAIKTSVRQEHSLVSGVHQIPTGTSRPPAGNAGRLFMNSQTKLLEYDTGSEWRTVSPAISEQIQIQPVVNVAGPVVGLERTYGSPVNVLLFGQQRMMFTIAPVVDTTTTMEIIRTPPGSAVMLPMRQYVTIPVSVLCKNITSLKISFYLDRPNAPQSISVLFYCALMIV